MRFTKAEKKQSRLRLALVGPAGSGKTFTALTVAQAFGDRVAVIDTERGSASKYAGDVAEFDVLELDTFAPRQYVDALRAAAREGYPVVVVDSWSHAWSGAGGALEMVDKAAAKSRSGNSFAAWREVTPEHNAMVDAILRYPGHVIVTMRAKTEWVLEEDDRGRKVPRKIGLAPVQRDGVEYEFDVVGDMDHEHRLVISKSRCSALSNEVISRPGKALGETLRDWLTDGAPAALPPASDDDSEPVAEQTVRLAAPDRMSDCQTAEELHAWCSVYGSRIARAGNGKVAAVVAHGELIGVSPADVRTWLGVSEAA